MLTDDLRAVEHVFYAMAIHIHGIIECFARSDAICVVVEVYRLTIGVLKVCEFSPLPCENTTANCCRITYCVVGYRLTVKTCEQVAPCAVVASLGFGGARQDRLGGEVILIVPIFFYNDDCDSTNDIFA